MKKSIKIKKFIETHGFASVTIGFLVAHSASKFIESIINGFIMALIQPLLGKVLWSDHVFTIGMFSFKWGQSFSTGLHFLIIITIAVFIIKSLQYEEEIEKNE